MGQNNQKYRHVDSNCLQQSAAFYLAKHHYEGKVLETEILEKGSEGLSRAQPGDYFR
jgi:hypothetical protein